MENKNERNENKIILETLILLLIKRTGMVEIKHKDFMDAALIMSPMWIMA